MANIGYLQITRDCNQSCRFCSNPPSGLDRTLEEDKRLVDDFVTRGYDGVILTGGEPTLVEHLPALIRYCKSVGLEPRMITNGQRLATPSYMQEIYDAGLRIIHCSLHSHRPEVHDLITSRAGAWQYLVTTLLATQEYPDFSVRVNSVPCRQNADHLDGLMQFVVDSFPNVEHVIFNGLDPDNATCDANRDVYYRMRDVEISLVRAMRILKKAGVSFRAEKVPLCYMLEFADCATETRKIVKNEERIIHFLDGKGSVRMDAAAFYHRKHARCASCSLDAICAGIWERGDMYDPEELSPVFVDPEPIRKRILADDEMAGSFVPPPAIAATQREGGTLRLTVAR